MKNKLVGFVDTFKENMITGWAANLTDFQHKLSISLICDGNTVSTTRADLHRYDLHSKGIGDGNHGFKFTIPTEISNCEFIVIFDDNEQILNGGNSIELKKKFNSSKNPSSLISFSNQYSQESDNYYIQYPNYSSTNPYQTLIASSLDDLWKSDFGDIDYAIEIINNHPEANVVFHLHWLTPIVAHHENYFDAERHISIFCNKLLYFIRRGGKIVWTIHNTVSHDRNFHDLETQLSQFVSDNCDLIHVHNKQAFEQEPVPFRFNSNKIIEVEHPSYIQYYRNHVDSTTARRKYGIPDNAVVFGFVGQIRPYKGIEELITAFRAVQSRKTSVYLLISGKAVHPYSSDFIKEIASTYPNLIVEEGFIPDSQLQFAYNACDFIVFPYKKVLTSGSLMSALSFNKPVICANLGGMTRLVQPGQNGFLYALDDPYGLEHALSHACDMTSQDLENLADGAGSSVLNYSWEKLTNKIIEELETRSSYHNVNIDINGVNHQIYTSGNISDFKKDKNNNKVAIIILIYKNMDDAYRILKNITDLNYREFDVFLIDNCSPNISIRDLFRLCDTVNFNVLPIKTVKNTGYAGGNNIGIKIASECNYRYTWIINPDIEFTSDSLDHLVNSANLFENPTVFGSVITYGTDKEIIWSAGGIVNFDKGLNAGHLFNGENIDIVGLDPYEVDYVTGAGIFCRTNIFDTYSYLPEKYFLYFEETDWSLALRQNGVNFIVIPQSRLIHHKQSEKNGLPTPEYFYYYIRNYIVFCKEKSSLTDSVIIGYLRRDFVTPWTEKINERAPLHIDMFTAISELAVDHGMALYTGYFDLTAFLSVHYSNYEDTNNADYSSMQLKLLSISERNITAVISLSSETDSKPIITTAIDSTYYENTVCYKDLAKPIDSNYRFSLELPIHVDDGARHALSFYSRGKLLYQTEYIIKPSVDYKGRIDGVAGFQLRGWAFNNCCHDEVVKIELVIDEKYNIIGVSNVYRKDLKEVGFGDGGHGFEINLPQLLFDGRDHVFELKLPNSRTLYKKSFRCDSPLKIPPEQISNTNALEWFSYEREYLFVPDNPNPLELEFQQTANYIKSSGALEGNAPSVSVIMPAFNREATIKDSILSIYSQRYDNFELLIIDDGSTDNTRCIVEETIHELGVDWIRLISCGKNFGVSHARNIGLNESSGDFIAYLDSDNTWHTDYLFMMLSAMMVNPEFDSCYCNQYVYHVVDFTEGSDGVCLSVRGGPFLLSDIENRNFIDLNCFIHKRSVFKELGGFNESMTRLVDWELIWRYAYNKAPYHLNIPLSNYFMGKADNQITKTISYETNLRKLTYEQTNTRARYQSHRSMQVEPSQISVLVIIEGDISTTLLSVVERLRYSDHIRKIIIYNPNNMDIPEIGFKDLSILNVEQGRNYSLDILIRDNVSPGGFLILTSKALLDPDAIWHLVNDTKGFPEFGCFIPQRVMKLNLHDAKDIWPYASNTLPLDVNSRWNQPKQLRSYVNNIYDITEVPAYCVFLPHSTASKLVTGQQLGCTTNAQVFKSIEDFVLVRLGAKIGLVARSRGFEY
ncbi:MAG: glycosyltransferase [Roseibium sp.]|nr:glycosyltransferase [Roseibium sp.]